MVRTGIAIYFALVLRQIIKTVQEYYNATAFSYVKPLNTSGFKEYLALHKCADDKILDFLRRRSHYF